MADVLPRDFEPIGDGSATFVFCEWSSSADADPRVLGDPAKGQYNEAYISIPARLDGKRVARVPYIWVDNDLSFARGHIQGFPKKAGTIAISRAVSVGSGGPKVEPGARFAGHVSSLGRRLASGSVTLNLPIEKYMPPALTTPVWHTRLMPDLAGGPPLVADLARNLVSDFVLSGAWTGPAELEFHDSEFEELVALAPLEVIGGFRCDVAFTITGAEARPSS